MEVGMPKNVRPILMLTFVNALGTTLLIPVLPFVVRDLGYSDFIYSVLIAVYPAAQFFAAPLLGGYADYRGRRPILIVSQVGTLLSWVLFAAAYFLDAASIALAVIVLSRVVDGLTGGNQSVASAYLADVVDGEQRTEVFSMQGAISGVALLIGPSIGSYSAASSLGFLGTALVAIAISTITLFAMFGLKESLGVDARTDSFDPNPLHQINLISRTRNLKGSGVLVRLFSTNFVFNFVLNSYTTIAILWYVDGLGVDESDTGLMLLAVGVFLIFNELVTLRFFERTFSDTVTLIVGLCVLPMAFLALTIPTSVVPFLFAAFLLNVGLALVIPTIQSLITRSADEREEGAAQGVNTSVTAAASATAPIVAGALYTAAGGPSTFAVLAAVAIVPALIALMSRARVAAAVDEAGTDTSVDDESMVHRRYGPIHALTERFSSGRGHYGMRLGGNGLQHHGLKE